MTADYRQNWLHDFFATLRHPRVIVALLFLSVGIPFLINLSYQLPFQIIHTEWSATDLLDYYGTLLGNGFAVFSIGVTVFWTVEQIRYQQHHQMKLTLLQEEELSIENCLEMIHPLKLHYAFWETISMGREKSAEHWISQIENYYLNLIISADILHSSFTKYPSKELIRLEEDILKIRNELIILVKKYENVIQSALVNEQKCSNEGGNSKEKSGHWDLFSEQMRDLDNQLQTIYETYSEILHQKFSLFSTEYSQLAQEAPKISFLG